MGRTKAKTSTKTRAAALAALASSRPSPPVAAIVATIESTEELLLKAAQFINQHEFDKAKLCAVEAVAVALAELEKERGEKREKDCSDALEILGTVELELGQLELAKEVRLRILQLSTLPG